MQPNPYNSYSYCVQGHDEDVYGCYLAGYGYRRPMSAMCLKDIGSSIKQDKTTFQVNLDVQYFTPGEINVKVVDGQLIVEASHEEKQDEHGYVTRKFCRRYFLPEDCDIEEVESRLSSDGVLTVIAPRKGDRLLGERKIPLVPTGPARKDMKKGKQETLGERSQSGYNLEHPAKTASST